MKQTRAVCHRICTNALILWRGIGGSNCFGVHMDEITRWWFRYYQSVASIELVIVHNTRCNGQPSRAFPSQDNKASRTLFPRYTGPVEDKRQDKHLDLLLDVHGHRDPYVEYFGKIFDSVRAKKNKLGSLGSLSKEQRLQGL